MKKVPIIKVDKVMPFSSPRSRGAYTSRMLLDASNSDSQKIQINHGTLKPKGKTAGEAHQAPYDEVYYVLSGKATLHIEDQDYEIDKGTLVFIPAETFHSLNNHSETEDFVILTIWPGQPEPGVSKIYDMRKEAWGKTFRELEPS